MPKHFQATLEAATVLNGLLAGATVDRLLVQMPAFHRLGTDAWADYSRKADLSIRGAALYPPLAIGGTLLVFLSAVDIHRHSLRSDPARLASCTATALAAAGLLMTIKAAPNMLGVRSASRDRAAELLKRFEFWSRIRGTLQILAFGATLWALTSARQRGTWAGGKAHERSFFAPPNPPASSLRSE